MFSLGACAAPRASDLAPPSGADICRYHLLLGGKKVGESVVSVSATGASEQARVTLATPPRRLQLDARFSQSEGGVDLHVASARDGRWEELEARSDDAALSARVQLGVAVRRERHVLRDAESEAPPRATAWFDVGSLVDADPALRPGLAAWVMTPAWSGAPTDHAIALPLDAGAPTPLRVEVRERGRVLRDGSEREATRLFVQTAPAGRSVWVEAGERCPLAMDNLALGLSAVRDGVTLPPRTPLPLPRGLEERDVSLGPEQAVIRGSLVLPSSPTPQPAVILIAGSGPVDRDGDAGPVRNAVLRELAYRLGEAGIASVRFDKRGVRQSDASAVPRGFRGLVDDATAWFDELEHQPEIASGCIFVLGHSEGGYVAADVSLARPQVAGLILLASPASELTELLLLQLPLVMRAHGATQSEIDEALELQRKVTRVLGRGGSERLERWGLSSETALWLSQHLERSATDAWRRVRAPVLALYGSDDLQVPPSEAEKLRSALSAPAEVATLEGVDHLMLPLRFRPGLGAYADPDRRLSPLVIERLSRWLGARACVQRARAGLAP